MIITKNNLQKYSFGKNPEGEQKRVLHGIPAVVTAEYTGYTGPKDLHFPTVPHLEHEKYPDITEQYNKLLNELLDDINTKKGNNRLIGFFKKCIMMGQNFKTGDKWDTKFLEKFPGRDIEGKVQYAKLENKIVTANQVSNRLYAESAAKLGFKRWLVILASHIDAAGLSNLIFEGKVPTAENLKFKDTAADQRTIRHTYDYAKKMLNKARQNKFRIG